MTGILLSLLLLLMDSPPIENADEVTVVFTHGGPDGIRGVACHADFREVEGNAQALCDGYADNTALIFTDELPAREFRYVLLETVAHEACHLDGEHFTPEASTAWEAFHEADCYRAGREYATEDWNQRTSAVRTVLMGDK